MSKKTLAEEKVSEEPVQSQDKSDLKGQLLELQAKLDQAIRDKDDAIKSAKLEAEEKAVAGVMKAIGLKSKDLEELARVQEQKKEIREFDIGKIVVFINGVPYSGRGRAPSEVVEVIMSMAGNKRMRELRAKIGNNHEIFNLAGGGFSSRIIGQSEESLA